MNIIFRKCNICGNIVWSFNDKDITCCNENMIEIKPNSVDASFEKHIPNYEIKDNKIHISVNHVMEDNHYIMWIMMVYDSGISYKEFKPGEEAKVTFDYVGECKIYSYCNLHSLWVNEVK